MANILVWGKGRDLIAGDLPAGITTEEIDGLSSLQSALESKGSTLVLADAAHLESERAALEAWVRSGGNRRALLVGVAEPSEADEVVRRHPYIDDVLTKPVTAGRLRLRLERGLQGGEAVDLLGHDPRRKLPGDDVAALAPDEYVGHGGPSA